jgi:hypothetical protein
MTPQQLANYLGQEIYVSCNSQPDYRTTLTPAFLGDPTGVKLILTPLSKITEEDLNEISEQILVSPGDLKDILRGRFMTQVLSINESVHVIDFLRSRGYAVGLNQEEYIDKTKI